MKITKNRKKINSEVDQTKNYSIIDAIKMLKSFKFTKFDESIDLAINLGVDPRHADQNIRLTTSLPHGTGKEVKVLVVTQGPKEQEAKDAGADYVGKEFLDKLKSGWDDVDKIVATPDMMPELGKLGKVLGPKGLMPNPKLGSVSNDLKKTINETKSGQVEIRNDKDGNIGVSIGKKSFNDDQLLKNYNAIIDSLEKEKSNITLKGDLIKKVFLTSTMGVSYKIKLVKNL